MDAKQVIQSVEKEKSITDSHIREVADWFHQNEGELFVRDNVISDISDDVSIDCPGNTDSIQFTNKLVSELVGDHVDPIQQISTTDERYVGVISYSEHDGYYTFKEYHDISGKYDRGVCAHCVVEASQSSEPFTRHTGDFGKQPYSDEDVLHDVMKAHVDEEHSGGIEVETGATLASGTTIAGNTSVHLGNETFVDEGGDAMTGTLNANGSPAIDVGQSLALIMSTTIGSGETLTVPSGEGMTQSGPITLDGTLEVNGSYTTTSSITGSGSITGTGRVEVL